MNISTSKDDIAPVSSQAVYTGSCCPNVPAAKVWFKATGRAAPKIMMNGATAQLMWSIHRTKSRACCPALRSVDGPHQLGGVSVHHDLRRGPTGGLEPDLRRRHVRTAATGVHGLAAS